MNERQKDLILYRLEQTAESIESAWILFNNGKHRPAVNRAYYAMFYAVLALLVTTEHSLSKHSGVISCFDKEFVKKGLFDKNLSRWLHEAFDLRQRADYTEMFSVSPERAESIIKNAISFVEQIRKHISIEESPSQNKP